MVYFVIIWYKTIYKNHFEQKFGWGFGYAFNALFSLCDNVKSYVIKLELFNPKPLTP